MDSTTEETIHHLAMVLRMKGPVAKAVAAYAKCTGDAEAVADMMLAQRLLGEALEKHDIPCDDFFAAANNKDQQPSP